MDLYAFHRGSIPLLISIPHAGTHVPEEIASRFTSAARILPDTDWWVRELYETAREFGASILAANYSRYVADLNRSPDSMSLYATHRTTPLCATETFTGESIYVRGGEPDAAEIAARVERYWRPYHTQLATELEWMHSEHGVGLLWDAHSIASEIPALFTGILPEFNFGTRDDASCPREIAQKLSDIVTTDGKFGAVLNGRFRGGYITGHYGRPLEQRYAVQLELARRAYMDEAAPAPRWDPARARSASAMIVRLLACFVEAVTGR
ncbi:MAG TPA: N-formylglutamate deformylase [Steroidobacter sp.]|jgi:N-formylglutamate deformylase|nr:N-formylglutamate deformylase [Steroidobacter sp.]